MFYARAIWCASLLALCATTAHAAGMDGAKIVKDGTSSGAAACSSCHGMDGAGMSAAGFPRLAGQNADYLAKQLRDMQQGLRNDAVMQPTAKALNDKEIAAVAKYYASLPAKGSAEPAASEDLLKKGEQLAKLGDWSKSVPACVQCHGENGSGVGAHFPAIAPQSANYLASQLRNWKSGARHNDPQDLMKTVAEKLSDDEVAAVAAYLASLGAR